MFVRSALEFRLGSLALAPRGRRRSVSAETRGQFLPASQRRPADNFSEWCGQFRGQFCVQFCVQFLRTIFLAKLAETLSRKIVRRNRPHFRGPSPEPSSEPSPEPSPEASPEPIVLAAARPSPEPIARAIRCSSGSCSLHRQPLHDDYCASRLFPIPLSV